ncbi:hypothetical protein CC1G_11003 [Coprinopsis cinerea okayama7|uniref:Uncharacterized protein n=1 Tax=Coprinopsis cinerea (strain Okayama-7 / 130 / ATCC MYA-4618 / FGSC 9003) TaxID=240176 RepID=A8P733_COPC7|nr:hypothetical protein CC1G_11003 [Coprinopsis cinerea okayama7\|eukprot:XP_001839281.2 hypothetical protein CC1G_11003 [Coprinopsis cinerea okayama7\
MVSEKDAGTASKTISSSDTDEVSDGWCDRVIDRMKRSEEISAVYATASGIPNAPKEEDHLSDYVAKMKNLRAQRRLQETGRQAGRRVKKDHTESGENEVSWLSDEELVTRAFVHPKGCETDGCAERRLTGEALRAMERVYRGPLNDDSIVHATSDSDAEDVRMLKALNRVALPQHMFSTPSPYKKLMKFTASSKPVPFPLRVQLHNLKNGRSHLQAKSFMALKNWKKVIQITSVTSPHSSRHTNAIHCHRKLRAYMKKKGWLTRK